MFAGSAAYPIKGLKLIFSKGYRRYAAIPILINIIVFAGLYGFGLSWFWHTFSDYTFALPSWLSWLQSTINFLGPVIFTVIYIGVGLALLLFLGSVSSLIACTLASPFNSFMVEKILVAHQIIPESNPFLTVMREALIRELQKWIFILPRLIFVFILFALFYFVPVLNLMGSALFFIFSGWMLAFEYLDYSAEAKGMKIKHYKKWLKQNRQHTYLFGMVSMALASIPFLNLLSMPACIAGGALLMVKENPDKIN